MGACSRKARHRRSRTIPRSRRSTSEAAMAERGVKPVLKIDELHVHYGESHAIQGVSLTLERGVLAVVGRNGMGKTTLCNTITGLKRARSGSIRVDGKEISALDPHEIHRSEERRVGTSVRTRWA